MAIFYPDISRFLRPRNRIKRQPICRTGFSLIELLSVVAIISILAAILIAVVSSTRMRANSTTSASNLRAIGMAIHLYMQDHDGYMPGPIKNGQSPFYGTAQSVQSGLPHFLYTYFDAPEPTVARQVLPVFTFPAYLEHDPAMRAPVYFAATSIRFSTYTRNPWGYANNDPSKSGTPSRLLYATDINAATAMLLTEIDQKSAQVSGSEGWFSQLAPEPYHGSIRNQLFLDGSVKAVEVIKY